MNRIVYYIATVSTSIFSFTDYKKFLSARLSESVNEDDATPAINAATLARRTGYQRSFFSRVLNGNLHLTTEGVYKVAKALGLSESEREYFFWLVESERAGDPDYRKYAEAKITGLRRANEMKQKSAMTPVKTDENYFASYLGTWVWAAVHLATAVPELQSPEKIAAHFGLPIEQVRSVIRSLGELGLVESSAGSCRFLKGSIHIAEDSPWVLFHHGNWRQKAMLDAQMRRQDSVHYTNLLTITAADFEAIRGLLLNAIARVMKIAQPSEPRKLVCLNLDLFQP